MYVSIVAEISNKDCTGDRSSHKSTAKTTKTAATAISLGCRFGGGVFSPSLFIGAMTGGAYGIIAASVYPELAAGHGLYAIVGMGATAAAVLGAPISTILMVFELTGDYELTIAVMIATCEGEVTLVDA